MYFSIITFFIALLGIIFMLMLKHFEIKSGKKSFLSRIAEGTDHFFHSAYAKFRFVISHINKHNAIVLAQWISFHVLSAVRKVYIAIREKLHRHPHSKKVIDMVTGKGEVTQNGGASFYLKKIGHDSVK